jgi:hypothetical protein
MLLDRLILPSPLLKIISVAAAMQRIFQERREQKRQVKKHVLFNSRPLYACYGSIASLKDSVLPSHAKKKTQSVL